MIVYELAEHVPYEGSTSYGLYKTYEAAKRAMQKKIEEWYPCWAYLTIDEREIEE